MSANDIYDAVRAEYLDRLATLKMAALNAKAACDPHRVKRLNVQIAQVELILSKEYPRRATPKTLASHFIDVCRDRLPAAQFEGLMEAARRLQDADQKEDADD